MQMRLLVICFLIGSFGLVNCSKKATPIVASTNTPTPIVSKPKATLSFKHEKEATLEQILATAKSKNKLVFIDFYTTWCGPCKWMDENVFSDDEVIGLYNKNFISYKVDAEDFEGVNTALKYSVNAYPTLLFLKPNGEIAHRIEGMMPRESFVQLTNTLLEEK